MSLPRAQPTDDRVECVSAGAPRFVSGASHGSPSARCISTRRSTAKTSRATAAQLLAQLNQEGGKTDISALGDPFMLDHQYHTLAGQ